MPYGPLWALVGGAIYKIGGTIPLAAVCGKVVMLAAWAAALEVVRRLTIGGPAVATCAAVLIFGWLPLSAEQSVADGHNDILLVLGILLWLLWLERDRRLGANLALVASILIKFVSGPLVLLSIMRARLARARGTTLLVELGAPLLVAAGLCALFATDLGVLAPLWATHATSGYRIADALSGLAPYIGAQASGALAIAARAGFVLTALIAVVDYGRSRTNEAGRIAALAIMLAVLFASGWRVFPWYLLWPLALAAVAATSALSRWTVGVALLMPAVWMRAFLAESRPFSVSRDGLLLLGVYLLAWGWVSFTRPARSA
jgi:alpha-1,6-mannosyltransferase